MTCTAASKRNVYVDYAVLFVRVLLQDTLITTLMHIVRIDRAVLDLPHREKPSDIAASIHFSVLLQLNFKGCVLDVPD